MKDYVEYKVKKGDWLSKIARDKTVGLNTYAYLASYNNNIKDSDKIEVGQIIRIPKTILKGAKVDSVEAGMLQRPKDVEQSKFEFKSAPKFEPKVENIEARSVTKSNSGKQKTQSKPAISTQTAIQDTDINSRSLFANLGVRRPKADTAPPKRSVKRSPMFDILPTVKNIARKAKSAYSSATSKMKDLYDDVRGTLLDNDIQDIGLIMRNGLRRKFGNTEGDAVSTMPSVDNIIEEPEIDTGYPSIYGDTIRQTQMPVSDRQYLLPSDINLSDVRFSGRNRGSRDIIHSPSALLPIYRELLSYDDYTNTHRGRLYNDSEGNINKYIGWGPDHRLKLGPYKDFEPGDTMSQTFYGEILNIPRDVNGNLIFGPSGKDSRRESPRMNVVDESGDTIQKPMPLMTPIRSRQTNTFDNVVGGGMLLKAGNNVRLIRGSIDDVVKGIERMKSQYPNEKLEYYEIDNGSYNRGLRTYDQIFTPNDLRNYDAQNRHAGHFIYALPGTLQ